MDKKHKLDAPNNDSLKTIGQLDDHSGLTTMYPHARTDWDGDIMSESDRATKRSKELEAITAGAVKWFAPIGLLALTPIVLAALIVAGGLTFITKDTATVLIFPLFLIVGIWMYLSVVSMRKLYEIFYNHALGATSFLIILLVLMGLAVQSIFMLTRPLQTASALHNVAIIGGTALFASVSLSLVLLLIWTGRHITANVKFGLIGVVAFILLAIATVATIA